MSKVAIEATLSLNPVSNALALTVVFPVNANGPVYNNEFVVGNELSRVYRNAALVSSFDNVTLTEPAKDPPGGKIDGGAKACVPERLLIQPPMTSTALVSIRLRARSGILIASSVVFIRSYRMDRHTSLGTTTLALSYPRSPFCKMALMIFW